MVSSIDALNEVFSPEKTSSAGCVLDCFISLHQI